MLRRKKTFGPTFTKSSSDGPSVPHPEDYYRKELPTCLKSQAGHQKQHSHNSKGPKCSSHTSLPAHVGVSLATLHVSKQVFKTWLTQKRQEIGWCFRLSKEAARPCRYEGNILIPLLFTSFSGMTVLCQNLRSCTYIKFVMNEVRLCSL